MRQVESGFHIENTLTHQFLAAARLLTKNVADRYQAAVDLSPAELSVLDAVGREPGISPSMIAARTGLDKVRVTRATQALHGKGLVRKDAHAADGRSRVLRLTKRGAQLRDASVAAVEQTSDALTGGLTVAERERLGRLLGKLRGGLPTAPVED